MSADYDNWDHGDRVESGFAHGRIHKARWWMVWRHVVWIFRRWQRRLTTITLSTGETLYVVSDGNGADSKEKRDE